MAPYKSSYYSRLLTFLGNFPHFKWNYSLYMNHSLQNINSVLDKCIIPRYLGTSQLLLSEKKFEPIGKKGIERRDGTTMVKVRTKIMPQITLLDENGSMSVVTMESARKLAEHKGLKLVNVTNEQEVKTDRPVYQLRTGAEDFSRKDDSLKGKSRKLLMINSGMAEHDLDTKIKIIKRAVSKDHEVRIILSDDYRRNNLDQVFKYMEDQIKDVGRLTNKHFSGNKVTFHAEPLLEEKDSSKMDQNKMSKKSKINDKVPDNKIKTKEKS